MVHPKKLIGAVLLLFAAMTTTAQVKIAFEVSFREPQAHYAEVEMSLSGLSKNFVDVKMPVWTPGSYLVREFEKSVEGFAATASGKKLRVEKVRKNAWRIFNGSAKNVRISYRVYAFELSVRTPYIDADHAFLSPTGIFMHPDGMISSPSTVKIVPFKTWSAVSTGLQPVSGQKFTYSAPNFDLLYDSPIEVGNQDVFEFMAAGVKHEVAMVGQGNYDKARLQADMPKIVEQATALYGENPNKYYVFIVHNVERGGGGLEHLNSTTLEVTRDSYGTAKGYEGFLDLVAHEYHHLWNVKRLRPVALGPFDYDNENYTTNLWVAEGFTSYYENKFMLRAGFLTPEQFVTKLAGAVGTVVNTPGARVQSAAASSYDAWIIGYRPNENSRNNSISYYSKGEVIGLLMDLEIIRASKGAKSLDDVMKTMYWQVKKNGKGYTDAEFKACVEQTAGVSFTDFWTKYVNGTDEVEYTKYLGYAGIEAVDDNKGKITATTGASAEIGRAFTITGVNRNSAAWDDGLNVNDIVLSVDGRDVSDILSTVRLQSPRVNLDILAPIADKKVGDKVNLRILRAGLERQITLTLKANPAVRVKATIKENASEAQKAVLRKWMGI
ncbi:PDZ domain-containing protein [Pedobacter sp. SYP-B3415]|uniref:M61 family metallopeptidase n=1 Tax=Pedobacter sp. SYP-B3415 TaxID=2496641 RepID=UPI001F118139|nr:PDZ domain-containing protein [Pedobacter sp. SYP-B3415]